MYHVLRYYYGAGDVVVTTPWYEPFGLTPLEAMACARPVIGSSVGGITYTIKNGETGLLVPARNPEALAARLHELLSTPERYVEMGRAARARVEREFIWPIVAMRTAALYETVLAEWPMRSGDPCGRQSLDALLASLPTVPDGPSIRGGDPGAH